MLIGIAVSPTAGKGTASTVGTELARALRAAGQQVIELSATGLAEMHITVDCAVHAGLGALVVVGGDGIVHLGIQSVAQTGIPLGIVPVGTGNDFAACAGIPLRTDRAIEALVAALTSGASAREVDLLRVTGAGLNGSTAQWVAGSVSAGLDAAVNARANRMRWPHGPLRYVVAALLEILRYRSWSYRVRMEGVALAPPQRAEMEQFPGMRVGDAGVDRSVTWKQRGALMTVANAATLGGGIRIAPRAELDDGYADVVVAQDVGRLTAARLFPLLVVGRHLRSKRLRCVPARMVHIASGGPREAAPPVYGDGEWLGTLPVQVEVRSRALRLVV